MNRLNYFEVKALLAELGFEAQVAATWAATLTRNDWQGEDWLPTEVEVRALPGKLKISAQDLARREQNAPKIDLKEWDL